MFECVRLLAYKSSTRTLMIGGGRPRDRTSLTWLDCFSGQRVTYYVQCVCERGGAAAETETSGLAMATSWQDEDEEFKVGGARCLGSRPRFSFSEIKMLLEQVRRNRYILLRKFNHGVSAEAKKQKWAEITDQINGLGQNHREVRQIMKKWADLKCDGKRRLALLRAPNGSAGRRKRKSLDSVEKMVHGILLMSPTGDVLSDLDDDEGPKSNAAAGKDAGGCYPYLDNNNGSLSLPGGLSFDFSPLSSPDKELSGDPSRSSDDDAEPSMDCDDNSTFSTQSSFAPPKLVHTYSRHNRNAVSTTSKECDADSSPASPPLSTVAAFPAVTSSSSPSLLPPANDSSRPAPPSSDRHPRSRAGRPAPVRRVGPLGGLGAAGVPQRAAAARQPAAAGVGVALAGDAGAVAAAAGGEPAGVRQRVADAATGDAGRAQDLLGRRAGRAEGHQGARPRPQARQDGRRCFGSHHMSVENTANGQSL
ncbi:uncharacterized protein LOC144033772 [Festucalex cinctus]